MIYFLIFYMKIYFLILRFQWFRGKISYVLLVIFCNSECFFLIPNNYGKKLLVKTFVSNLVAYWLFEYFSYFHHFNHSHFHHSIICTIQKMLGWTLLTKNVQHAFARGEPEDGHKQYFMQCLIEPMIMSYLLM